MTGSHCSAFLFFSLMRRVFLERGTQTFWRNCKRNNLHFLELKLWISLRKILLFLWCCPVCIYIERISSRVNRSGRNGGEVVSDRDRNVIGPRNRDQKRWKEARKASSCSTKQMFFKKQKEYLAHIYPSPLCLKSHFNSAYKIQCAQKYFVRW